MKLRNGFLKDPTDPYGPPVRATVDDRGPAHGAVEGRGFHGSVVVGERGAVEKDRRWKNAARTARRIAAEAVDAAERAL